MPMPVGGPLAPWPRQPGQQEPGGILHPPTRLKGAECLLGGLLPLRLVRAESPSSRDGILIEKSNVKGQRTCLPAGEDLGYPEIPQAGPFIWHGGCSMVVLSLFLMSLLGARGPPKPARATQETARLWV